MLDLYKGECMLSITNINNGINKSTRAYQNCSTNQMLKFDGNLKALRVRRSMVGIILYTQVIVRVNTILNHHNITHHLHDV